jgi:hypothetical protein
MRLPVLRDEEMTERLREPAARLAGRRGAVRGSSRVWPRSPEMGERAESVPRRLRPSARARCSTAVRHGCGLVRAASGLLDRLIG